MVIKFCLSYVILLKFLMFCYLVSSLNRFVYKWSKIFLITHCISVIYPNSQTFVDSSFTGILSVTFMCSYLKVIVSVFSYMLSLMSWQPGSPLSINYRTLTGKICWSSVISNPTGQNIPSKHNLNCIKTLSFHMSF